MAKPEWEGPTLQHEHARKGISLTDRVRCECGRLESPCMMYDVRGVDVCNGKDFVCQGCVETLFRNDVVDRVTFHAQRGAPPDWVSWYEDKLTRHRPSTGVPKRLQP